jgi:cytochrome c peroxidase
MRSGITFVLCLTALVACSAEPAQPTQDPLQPPLGLERAALETHAENPLTAEKAALGKLLFFDPRLSGSGKMGCVDCHYVDKSFTDGKALSVKDNGSSNTRNSPTMYNVGYLSELYWDGRAKGLEANVKAAWTGQLGGKPELAAERLNAVADYVTMFEKAFGGPANEERIVFALTSFLRTLRSGDSPFDRWQNGDQGAVPSAAKQGYELFLGRTGCAICHTPPLFTNRLYHNVGIGMKTDNPDVGRAKPADDPSKTGAFKTPTLREVAKTAPYFHDGSVATLREAVKIMASGGIPNSHLDPLLVDRGLGDDEIAQIVAFLETLSTTRTFDAPKLPK